MGPPSTLLASGDGNRIEFTPDTAFPLIHLRIDAAVYGVPTQRLISMFVVEAIYGNGDFSEITLSADGNWAVWASSATHLVPGITITTDNIFVLAITPALDFVFTI